MISEHSHRRDPRANHDIAKGFHLLGLAIVGKIAGQHEDIGLLAHTAELIVQRVLTGSRKMQVGGGCNSHLEFPFELIVRRRRSRCSCTRLSRPHSLTSMANILSSIRLPRNLAEEP